jgi:molybdate-binding protein/DNA-binding XRE family transcriptional regulator
VSRPLVSAIEVGRHQPSVDAALALARALGTTVEALFGRAGGGPVDALSGAAPAAGAGLRVGRVGDLLVSAVHRIGDEGWDAIDGVAGDPELDSLASTGSGVVMAGCEPALVLLERILRDRGTPAMAITTSSATALGALAAGRLHVAAVHFPRGARPRLEGVPLLRVKLARWRVGLAARSGSGREWWKAALSGRGRVVQREAGAAAQAAFERAASSRKRPIPGPRVGSHLTASRVSVAGDLPAVTIEPAAAAVGAAFHPIETHEVELWVHGEHAAEAGVQRLLDLLGSVACRRTLEAIGGYDLSSCGSRAA